MAAGDDNRSDESSSENEGEQIRVSFLLDSSIKDRSLEVPSEPIAVPSTLGRKGLSAVINHLLDRVEEESDDDDDEGSKLAVLPFDFIVQNNLLRTGIETAARRHGMSLEQAVPITYFPAQTAPESRGESEPMPDWISSLVYQQGLLISGGYNGSICLFEKSKDNDKKKHSLKTVSTVVAHSGPIKCMASVPRDDNNLFIATGSLDHTLKTHVWDSNNHELKLHAEYRDGHTSSIGSVDLQKKGNLMASGDWDGGLCLWDYTKDGSIVPDEPTKKLKTGAISSKSSNGAVTVAPKVVLQAHASQISGLSWGNSTENDATLVTGSWDHSLKVWDMERQDCLLTLNGSRVVACLDTSQHSQVVATGHPDCTVRLWDVRVDKKEETSTITTDTSLKPRHKAWVSGVKWCPSNPYVLASTSHDGTIKIWDIRSSLPLFSVRAHGKEEKGLCLAYGDDGIIYAGGTDCVVKQYYSSND